MSERKSTVSAAQPATTQTAAALHWWQIMANRQSARLPFSAIYSEALQDADQVGLDEELMVLLNETRIVEPVEGWQRFYSSWDDDFVEDWFDEGEALQHSTMEVEIDEPDRLERAIGWLRSLFIASNPWVRTA